MGFRQFICDSSLILEGRQGIMTLPSRFGVVGSLHFGLGGGGARGLFHARVKRVVMLGLLYWATRFGWAAFRALLSSREEVTVCQVAFQPLP